MVTGEGLIPDFYKKVFKLKKIVIWILNNILIYEFLFEK